MLSKCFNRCIKLSKKKKKKTFIDQCKWEKIDFPAQQKEWKNV